MSFRQYLTLMFISSCLGWLTWGFIIAGVNPNDAGLGIFFLFYASLLIALSCTLSIAGLVLRVWILRQKEIISRQASKSFRQAVLLAFFAAGVIFFQSKGILSWWIAILFITALSAVELFLVSVKPREFKQ